jgi:hypothetical protein
VVADKHAIAHAEQAKRTTDPKYRYRPDSLYDHLTGELFSGMHRFADEHRLCVAKRGNKERNEALSRDHAEGRRSSGVRSRVDFGADRAKEYP